MPEYFGNESISSEEQIADDYISDGQHVGYTEYEEPKNKEGLDYIYDLQVDDVAYWFQ